MAKLSRRDFIKLVSLLPAAYALPPGAPETEQPTAANFLVLLFDTWSARNISLYGYPRETTPNLSRLAEKAIVYHNHYAASYFTYPGTTSLLTGVYPWMHRGFISSKKYLPFFSDHNLFSLFEDHHRVVYTHNPFANDVLDPMAAHIDAYKPRQDLFIDSSFWLSNLFSKDYNTASVGWTRVIKKFDDGYANSLFLSRLYDLYTQNKLESVFEQFPNSPPLIEEDNYYILETAIDWIIQQAQELPAPYLGYFQLLPPHQPYNTRIDFYQKFEGDGFKSLEKPDHIFSMGLPYSTLEDYRQDYDEFICYADAELGRLYQTLEASGALENTWIILTSDHGEMFERGIWGHRQPAMNQPLVHIPLLILPPGQQERIDIYSTTSAVDVLPTLLTLKNKPIPSWIEGVVLPPFNTAPQADRSIFSIGSTYSEQSGPLTPASIMMVKENFKLIHHYGDEGLYKRLNGKPLEKLYDIETDPEEMQDLAYQQPSITKMLVEELLSLLQEKESSSPADL